MGRRAFFDFLPGQEYRAVLPPRFQMQTSSRPPEACLPVFPLISYIYSPDMPLTAKALFSPPRSLFRRTERVDIYGEINHLSICIYIASMCILHIQSPSFVLSDENPAKDHMMSTVHNFIPPKTNIINNAVTYINLPAFIISSGSIGRRSSPINSFL